MHAATNLWNNIPFHPIANNLHVMPQSCKGDLSHIFMEDGKEDFSKWCEHFEVAVEATPN